MQQHDRRRAAENKDMKAWSKVNRSAKFQRLRDASWRDHNDTVSPSRLSASLRNICPEDATGAKSSFRFTYSRQNTASYGRTSGLAGLPTTVAPGATLRRTTAPAPTIARAPIVTPPIIKAPSPTKTPSSIVTLPAVRAPGDMDTWSPMILSWSIEHDVFRIQNRPTRASCCTTTPADTIVPTPTIAVTESVAAG